MRTTPVLLLFALAAGGCAQAPKAASRAGAPADWFPLAVGNEWVYADRSPQLSPKDQAARQRTVRILSRDADGYYLDNEKGALRADPDCIHDRLRRLLCAPFEPGHAWSSVVSVGSTERYEIVAVGERVQTPAGAFDGCLRVRAHTRAGSEAEAVLEITYAPRVGPVRIETFAVVKNVVTPQVRAELKSYRVEGK
ncbi:MAG: hypothetical protein ACXWLI_08145 [Myxococcaceae bacterium]